MESMDRKERCEQRITEFLDDCGLPQPDDIEYGDQQVRFLWTERKVGLIVDLEDFEEIDANGGYSREGLAA